MLENYDTLVVVTPTDYRRLQRLYGRLARNLPGQLYFVGSREVGELVQTLKSNCRHKQRRSRAYIKPIIPDDTCVRTGVWTDV